MRKQMLLGAALSAFAVFLLFALSVRDNGFVDFDDYVYIVDNNLIATLNWSTIKGAFTTFTAGNWHPVTMLSLMLDRQLWGLDPVGFHITNCILHGVTVFCLSLLFFDLLRIIWPETVTLPSEGCADHNGAYLVAASIGGALFFGLHPLRVESVAWASSRKDVLCLFFIVMTLWTYIRYTTTAAGETARKFWGSPLYLSSAGFAGMALLSKPLAVSLPFLLLLLDWYPLGRFTSGRRVACLLEKAPFLLMSVGIGVVTLSAQNIAMDRVADLTGISRLLVAGKALLFYLEKTVWPMGLSPLYFHPGNVAGSAPGQYLAAVLLVVALTIAALLAGRQRPLWPALWFFYVITLAPMLGVIQVGKQWVADRYSYLPAVGLSLLWGGGVLWLVITFRKRGRSGLALATVLAAGGQLAVLAFLTAQQVALWRDTGTLASRVIEIAPEKSPDPYYYRAGYRNHHGEDALALTDIDRAIGIALRERQTELYPRLGSAKASILSNLGRFREALEAANWAVESTTAPVPEDLRQLRDELARHVSPITAEQGAVRRGE